MGTTNETVDTDWAEVLAGPTTDAGTISPVSAGIQIAILSSTPASNFIGFNVYKNSSYNFALASGESLYAKSLLGTVIVVINS